MCQKNMVIWKEKSKILIINKYVWYNQHNKITIKHYNSLIEVLYQWRSDCKDLVLITSPKAICVNWPIKINGSLKHDTKLFVSGNESIAEFKMQNKIGQLSYVREYAYEHLKNSLVIY